MNLLTQTLLLSASTLRMLPHIAIFLAKKKTIADDLQKVQDGKPTLLNFIKACTRERTFRNLFYYRIGEYLSAPIQWLLPPERTLTIWCPSIGPGAHFEHNYATYLNTEDICQLLFHQLCISLQYYGIFHNATLLVIYTILVLM